MQVLIAAPVNALQFVIAINLQGKTAVNAVATNKGFEGIGGKANTPTINGCCDHFAGATAIQF